ncbi:hypothetical protein CRG98_042477 [Punica granatum]|uniref:MATH domain-containing protein n=1 Tax=Punica granatum TaxID=22663 RepID=A0A2I0HZK4_PUNGR|nr:hypothetical protein CRG98_042477 [Punica granatum]
MEVEEPRRSGKYSWRIDSFSMKKNENNFRSEAFTVGGCEWRILIYPKGNRTGAQSHLSIYLEVADAAILPDGWCRVAKSVFTLVNQESGVGSTKIESRLNRFGAGTHNWGFEQFMPLAVLHDHTKGYVVNDTVVLEVEITLHEVAPPIELTTQMSRLDSYFSCLSVYFGAAGNSDLRAGSASRTWTIDLASDSPSADDIEKAKHSLKECLSDLFRLNMTDRLSSALSILSHARAGLSPDQQRSIETFKANFDDFVCDLLTFEQDNSDFELQKITWNHLYSAMKKNHETHLSYKQSFDGLTEEEEELKKRLKEVPSVLYHTRILIFDMSDS